MGSRSLEVLALDLSLTCCGWASTAFHPQIGQMQPGGRGVRRLRDFEAWLLGMLEPHALVVVEGYSFGSRGRAVFSIGELGGVARLAMEKNGIPFVDIPPSNVKKFATGKGNASKDLVLVEAVKRLGYEGASNDEADALWMLNMARVHYGLEGAPDLPKSHLKALEKIDWPEVGLLVHGGVW